MFSRSRRKIPMVFAAARLGLLIVGASLTAGLASAAPAGNPDLDSATIELVPHRAIYELKLAQTRGSRSAETVTGRILYDFSGNSCDGYALQFRQVSEMNTSEGKAALSDLRTITWEDGTAT